MIEFYPNIEYVSFDFFDTLIKRDVPQPKDIFKLIEIKAKIGGFQQDRIKAEHDLYPKKKYEEITLEEIYDNFDNRYNIETLNCLKKMEEDLEFEMCIFNENIREIYNKVIKLNKKIIITTDTYLPEELIKKILKKNNIHYDELFVSSTIRKRKSTGNLFKHVINSLNTQPENVFHIGDNKISDYKMAKKSGINAYKINNHFYNTLHCNNKINLKHYNFLKTFINNRIYVHKDYYEKIGYECLGPLLYGFCNWLNKEIQHENITNLLFLSRDGKIIKECFDKIYENKYKTSYFYASRRALIIPNLKNYKDCIEMLSNYALPKTLKLKSLISKFGLSVSQYETILKKYQLSEEMEINTNEIIENKNIINFLYEIYPDIIKNSNKEYNKASLYINNNVPKNTNKVAIVDIGWYGNMQNNLEKIVDNFRSIEIFGYYLGLVPKFSNKFNKKMNSYIFNTNDKNFETYIREKNFNSLFELFFSADHGSVVKYLDSSHVELKKMEYDETQMQIIKKIQHGAKLFIEDYKKTSLNVYLSFDEKIYYQNMFDLGNNPTLEDAIKLGDLLFMDNSISKISNYDNDICYFLHPLKAFKAFKSSQWKIAFLKRLFRINLKYEKICRIIRGNKIR